MFMSHAEPEHNRPQEWQGGGTDRRRNPERVKELEKQLATERKRYEKLRMETTGQVTGQSKKGNDSAANRDSDSFSDSRTVIKSYSAEAYDMLQAQLASERQKHDNTCKWFQEQLAAEREAGVKVYLQLTLLEKKLAAERAERCEVCNGELSQCGVQGIDGEPSLDCLVCKLREQLAAERESHEKEMDVVEANWNAALAAERADRISWQELYEKTNEQLQAQLIGYRGTAASGGTPP
jgi:hypothetical protein